MEAKENEGMMESVKAEVLLITKNFWQALADRDIEKRFLQCADTITFIGTGVDEKASGKAEYYAINKKGVEQYPEKFKLEILWERASVMDDVGWVESETEWAQMINGKEEKTLIRNSILLKKIGDQWWIMHVHGSVPDFRLSGQNYITNAETIKINRELESEVYQRTKELEKKNKELEIESSLEKVRTVAMGMRKPDDMLLVCKIISEQLQMLQINDIRNVQTAIIDEQGGKHYMNYQYFTQYAEGTIEEVEIAKHPAVVDMIRNMQQSTDAFFRHSFEGVELEKWIQYRKEDHQFSDPILEASSAVHFYFYSIGEGGLGISAYTPLSENDLSIFHRFRNVFSLAYQRFRDIEKAEAQAREALIEASLERVRARSMAMQRSEELVEASNVLFSELHKLGIEPIRTGVGTVDIEKESVVVWSSQLVEHNEIKILGEVPRHTHPFFDGYYTAWLNKEPWFTYTMKGDTLRSYYQGMSSILSYPSKTEFNPEETFSIFFFQEGSLNVITHTPLMEEECRLMQRFANVFGLIYRRFLDLKLAEAQAREGQIELALERVRARTMAMQRSDELSETAHLLFQQLKALGESPLQITIGIVHEEDRYIEFRVTDWAGGGLQINRGFNASIDEPTLVHKMFIAWKEQHKSLVVDLSGKELEDWVTYRNAMSGITVSSTDTNGRRVITCAFFSRGHISFSSPEPRPKETIQLLERFAGVFDQTYTRFLDLQRSEAQAKEARIEAALERVRSRTMGMQKSEELKEVIQVVYDQFVHLNIKVEHTGFVMDYKTRDDHHIWIADKVASPAELTIPYFDAVYYNQFNEAKTKGLDFFATLLTFEQKNKFYQDLFKYVPGLPEEALPFLMSCPGLAASTVLLENIGLYIENFSGIPFTEEENVTLMRFGKVFQQTYTRFLDLQKAEAQAREAQTEAALERVRAKAMAMHNSEDMAVTVDTFFTELNALGVTPRRCGVGIIDRDTQSVAIQATSATKEMATKKVAGILKLYGHPVLDNIFSHWLEQKEYHPVLHGQEILEYYNIMNPQVAFPDFVDDEVQYGYYFFFKEGDVFAWTDKEYGEDELNIFRKFTSVLSLTHKRYMDLIQAEANAREFQIETGLERVRSRTMAMQSCDELAETAAVVLNELIKLGIAPSRLYIAIIENDNTDVNFYLTNEEGGKDCSVYTAQIEKNASVRKMYDGWAAHQTSLSINMEGEELAAYFQYLREDVGVPYKNTTTPSRRIQTIAYFSQGYIGIASPDDQPEETTKLLERFAAVFNLTYTRFNDLKQAEKLAHQANLDLFRLKEEKARTEVALAELKATQAQLIQAEKMASLGELTAGIAHEIQNPLNFVNNFSEVNTELIAEMKQELQTGNTEEAIAIANDIADNEQKINHHGKRADAIVKGMLQHSRSSSGAMEPTDINALADEYLRLAYHGLRAKDKSFNATMKTDFDPNIGLVNVIPQDIGRVILNLITNAFYAVSAPKSPIGDLKYQPTVTISTRKESHTPSHSNPLGIGDLGAQRVAISVSDNGPGIPQHILDKIFQPFFTTKPTGQGTGLGLSLSYDIVKAHGGELKVETEEGVGSRFVITLPII